MTNPAVTHELVNLSDLTIDPRVQRREGVNAGRAAQIAANHNPAALGSLTLSRRKGGVLVILDGAHRVEACRLAKVIVGIYNKGRRRNLLPEWVWTR